MNIANPSRQGRLFRSDHERRGPDGKSFSPLYLLKFNDAEIELIPHLDWLGPDSWIRTVIRGLK